MNRLSTSNLPEGVALPGYDRAVRQVGIFHFGLGAFTRAHQAWYTDRAIAEHDGDWLIMGVSPRSADVGEQFNPKDGPYTLAEKSGEGMALRVIGRVGQVLLAATQRDGALLCRPHIVTVTVTEKSHRGKGDGTLELAQAEAGFYPVLADERVPAPGWRLRSGAPLSLCVNDRRPVQAEGFAAGVSAVP